jgi:plastocyanin
MQFQRLLLRSFLTLLLACRGAQCDDTDWGHLRGRLLVSGDTPSRRTIKVSRDISTFGEEIIDDALLVDSKSNGIANVIIYMDVATNQEVAVHPSYSTQASSEALIVAKGGRFQPRVLWLQAGQVLRFRNEDPFRHNFNLQTSRNQDLNELVAAGEQLTYKFSHSERVPVHVVDGIYNWMSARIIISNHPYVALSDERGTFEIRNLPVGIHRFRLWHECIGFLKKVSRNKHEESLDKGRFMIGIERGDNELGEMTIDSSLFPSS